MQHCQHAQGNDQGIHQLWIDDPIWVVLSLCYSKGQYPRKRQDSSRYESHQQTVPPSVPSSVQWKIGLQH
eukprot:1734208-Ditylum_brightwellii.AAC.1